MFWQNTKPKGRTLLETKYHNYVEGMVDSGLPRDSTAIMTYVYHICISVNTFYVECRDGSEAY